MFKFTSHASLVVSNCASSSGTSASLAESERLSPRIDKSSESEDVIVVVVVVVVEVVVVVVVIVDVIVIVGGVGFSCGITKLIRQGRKSERKGRDRRAIVPIIFKFWSNNKYNNDA